jgi:hypothetical protein
MRSEAELIPPIRRRLAKNWKDTRVFEEFGVGFGVADVVAAALDHAALNRRSDTGNSEPLTRRSSIRVLDALRGGRLDFTSLEAATRLLPTTLRTEIRTLVAAGFVTVEDGHLHLRKAHSRVAREVWAVEAKVQNWTDGMRQATRYQSFADRVYLAIAEEYVHRVDVRVLRSFNIGLIVVAEEARIAMHPLRAAPTNADLSALTSERIWSLTASSSKH